MLPSAIYLTTENQFLSGTHTTSKPCASRPDVIKAKEYRRRANMIIQMTLDLFRVELHIPSLLIGK